MGVGDVGTCLCGHPLDCSRSVEDGVVFITCKCEPPGCDFGFESKWPAEIVDDGATGPSENDSDSGCDCA